MSFLLETHNMSSDAIRVVRDLREYPNPEIIVMDDGSSHNHTRHILDELNGVNEFVLHFNDLFSTLTINRAIGFAHGEYIVKLQDDDIYPGTEWIDEAIGLFAKHPDLMIIGGRGSLNLPVGWNFAKSLPWQPYCKKFEFVPAINEAPMWYRRADFLELGGLDEGFAPCYWSEQEICFRAWLAGKSVGWYLSGVKRCAIDTGLRRKNKQMLQHESWRKNSRIFSKKFGSRLGFINGVVRERNRTLCEGP